MTEKRTKKWFKRIVLTISLFFSLFGICGSIFTLFSGLNTWGINSKTVWGIAIVNFVFWIGNAHSGTLISAVFYLLNQKWSFYIHRIAETITIISIILAMFYPMIHLGRPWFFYWLFPLPNQMSLWTNFKSPLLWDVYAIIVYGTLSSLFWFLGFVPEIKDFKVNRIRFVRNFINSIWIGSEENWNYYWKTYRLLAGTLTFVVISVHSIVAYDFGTSILPIWHTTIQPIFFIIGAIYSGIALVLALSLFLKFKSERFSEVPEYVFEKLGKIILSFSLIMLYFYLCEAFFVYYSQNYFEAKIYELRLKGYFGYVSLIILLFNIIFPQILWLKQFRENKLILFFIAIFIVIGMWLERFIILIPSLSYDFTSQQVFWYFPTIVDYSLLLGSLGFFLLGFYFVSHWVGMVPENSKLVNK